MPQDEDAEKKVTLELEADASKIRVKHKGVDLVMHPMSGHHGLVIDPVEGHQLQVQLDPKTGAVKIILVAG